MNFIGSKTLETDRLILKAQTMKEQKILWQILCIDEVNKYYLTIPTKFREKFKNWEKQESFYQEKVSHANANDIFCWSVFLKETKECIGQIGVHEAHNEDESITDKSIRGIGWFINPKYQRLGLMTEAASIVLDYMFNEVEISEIRTGAAIENPASWKLMEKLLFKKRGEQTHFTQYTFLDTPTECYSYGITIEEYLVNISHKTKNRKREYYEAKKI